MGTFATLSRFLVYCFVLFGAKALERDTCTGSANDVCHVKRALTNIGQEELEGIEMLQKAAMPSVGGQGDAGETFTVTVVWKDKGEGECVDQFGDNVFIGWSPCTCDTAPFCSVGNCKSLERCKEDCVANADCAAVNYRPGFCWLFRQMSSNYESTDPEEYQHFNCSIKELRMVSSAANTANVPAAWVKASAPTEGVREADRSLADSKSSRKLEKEIAEVPAEDASPSTYVPIRRSKASETGTQTKMSNEAYVKTKAVEDTSKERSKSAKKAIKEDTKPDRSLPKEAHKKTKTPEDSSSIEQGKSAKKEIKEDAQPDRTSLKEVHEKTKGFVHTSAEAPQLAKKAVKDDAKKAVKDENAKPRLRKPKEGDSEMGEPTKEWAKSVLRDMPEQKTKALKAKEALEEDAKPHIQKPLATPVRETRKHKSSAKVLDETAAAEADHKPRSAQKMNDKKMPKRRSEEERMTENSFLKDSKVAEEASKVRAKKAAQAEKETEVEEEDKEDEEQEEEEEEDEEGEVKGSHLRNLDAEETAELEDLDPKKLKAASTLKSHAKAPRHGHAEEHKRKIASHGAAKGLKGHSNEQNKHSATSGQADGRSGHAEKRKAARAGKAHVHSDELKERVSSKMDPAGRADRRSAHSNEQTKRVAKVGEANGKTATLDEEGFQAVAALHDSEQMAKFIRRSAAGLLHLEVRDEAHLKDMAAMYDGEVSDSDFVNMLLELEYASRYEGADNWLALKKDKDDGSLS